MLAIFCFLVFNGDYMVSSFYVLFFVCVTLGRNVEKVLCLILRGEISSSPVVISTMHPNYLLHDCHHYQTVSITSVGKEVSLQKMSRAVPGTHLNSLADCLVLSDLMKGKMASSFYSACG